MLFWVQLHISLHMKKHHSRRLHQKRQTAFESVLNVAVNYRHDICFLKFYGGHGNEDNKACDEKG